MIDDGSTDSSAKICEEYAKRDDRIKVFHKKNGGPASAKNLGIEKSSGEYFCILDSDDIYEMDFLAEAYKVLREGEIEVYITGFIEEIWSGGKIIETNSYKVSTQMLLSPKEVVEKIGKEFPTCIFVSSCGILYKSSIIKEHKIRNMDLMLGEDFCFNFEVLR